MRTPKFSCAAGVIVLFLFICTFAETVLPQSTILLPDRTVREIIAETSGDIALNNEMMLGAFEQNRPESEYTGMFRETVFMLSKLKEYGFSDVHLEKFESRGTQWDAVRGRLTIVSPFKEKIADHDEVAASLARNSGNANVIAELVYVPDGTQEKNYEGIDVAGKIVISEGRIGSVFSTAVTKLGAAGVVSYETRYPERYPDMLLWNSVPAGRGNSNGFGFNITYTKGMELIDMLKRGEKVVLRADVETARYSAKLEVVSALIPGIDRTDQELLLIAHLFEGISKQGGNDNYSGSVCILETGRTILELIKSGVIKQPRRNIRFLWVPEIVGTRAYIKKYPDEIKKIIAGINMDMVGEDLVKTRSVFHVSRTARSVPSFFNDIVQEFAELTVEMNNDAHNETYGKLRLKITSPNGSQMPFILNVMGYDSGSDHSVLSNGIVRVPTVYFECWPDDFYHSSYDTPDKTDPTQLKRVAFIAASSIITAAAAGTDDAHTIITLVEGKGRERIADETARANRLLIETGKENLNDAYKKGRTIIDRAFHHEIDNINSIKVIAENDKMVLEGLAVAIDNLNNEMKTCLKSFDNKYRLLCGRFDMKYREPELSQVEKRLGILIPGMKSYDMVTQMDTPMMHGLPRSHDVFQYRYAIMELNNLINGKHTILDIAKTVMAECGGPDLPAVEEYFKALEQKGCIVINKK